jgi:two-component system CitB family sensor kinase
VRLSLTEDTRLAAELVDPRAVLTVIGNLVDNAIDAAREGAAEPPWVEVGLRLDGDALLAVRVEDAGPGVPPELREAVFEPGWSTKPAAEIGARGVGLSLVRRLVERRGGGVEVRTGRAGGAVFEVRMPVRLAVEVPV